MFKDRFKGILQDENQRKSLLFLIIRGLSIVFNYGFSFLVIKYLSGQEYGEYVFGMSIFMLLSVFFKLGIDVHYVKIFAEKVKHIIPIWVKRVDLIVFVFALFSVLVILFFQEGFNKKPSTNIFFFLSIPLNVFVLLQSGKLRGISHINQFAFLNIAGRIIFTALIFIALAFGLNKLTDNTLGLSHFVAIFALSLLSYYWIKRNFKTEKSEKLIPKNFFAYNRDLMFKSYLTVFFLWGDRFFLKLFTTEVELAKYDIALKIAMTIVVIYEAVNSTYAPVFAKYRNNKKMLDAEVRKSTKMGFIVSILIFIVHIVLGKFLLGLFGQGFEGEYLTLLVISLGYIIAAYFGQAVNILEMNGYIKQYLPYNFIIVLLAIIIGITLSLKLGALGMAIGFSLGIAINQIIGSLLVKRKIGIETRFRF